METKDLLGLLHPVLAVVFVFPLIGMVVGRAWVTRQRRLQTNADGKSKIPPVVGQEHFRLGRWLTGSVVGVALIGLAFPIFTKFAKGNTFSQEPLRAWFVVAMFAATIASLVLLYMTKSNQSLWRGVFATLSGMGLILLGSQPEVYRRAELSDALKQPDVWEQFFTSHYYIGVSAALLMIFSLAIVPDIYRDRSNRWRNIHTILNCIALLLFIGQGMTGARDLLEIPLSWQEPYIYQCDFNNKTCPTSTPKQSQATPEMMASLQTGLHKPRGF